ncbi:MAG: hypothetical protein QOF83_1040 [Solirubrobacteraceae bacterium]|nr:hypothetical protein [Solirubrobacteraceae bacterium]
MERWMPDSAEFPEAEQERVKALIGSADASAPPALRAQLEAMIAQAEREQPRRRRPEAPWRRARRVRPERRRVGWALPGLAAGAVAAAVVIVLALGGGTTVAPPNVQAAAAVALAAPTAPAPTQTGDRLDVSAGGIPFPYWQASVGWRAVGTRTDSLHGRHVVTVFYSGATGERVGYSIVAGEPLAAPAAPVVDRQGVAFTVLHPGGANVITWQRDGHTCVIASHSASTTRLIQLATSPA